MRAVDMSALLNIMILCISIVSTVNSVAKRGQLDDELSYPSTAANFLSQAGRSKISPPIHTGHKFPERAIIAIEIVDSGKDTVKNNRTSKRTIESSVGYGSYTKGKFEIYPYSQHDIPPAPVSNNYYPAASHQVVSTDYHDQNQPAQTYQQSSFPSTTLFSTLNQGHVGALTTQFPTQDYGKQETNVIPVIILRVYTDQLGSPALYANLPTTSPYASNLNTINLQALLSPYLQQNVIPAEYQPHYQPAAAQQSYSISENYPSDTHTRVVFNPEKKNKPVFHVPAIPSTVYKSAVPSKQAYYVTPATKEQYYAYTDPKSGQQYVYRQDSGHSAESNQVYATPAQYAAEQQGYSNQETRSQNYYPDQQEYVYVQSNQNDGPTMEELYYQQIKQQQQRQQQQRQQQQRQQQQQQYYNNEPQQDTYVTYKQHQNYEQVNFDPQKSNQGQRASKVTVAEHEKGKPYNYHAHEQNNNNNKRSNPKIKEKTRSVTIIKREKTN